MVISQSQAQTAAREIIKINPRFEIVIERSGFCTIGLRENRPDSGRATFPHWHPPSSPNNYPRKPQQQ